MATFGWSAGDIVQGIKVVTAVCRAFSSTKGAEAHFAETVAFLRGLLSTLEAIEQHITDANGNLDGKYSAHIMGILETIEPPFKSFVQYVESYIPALGVNSSKSSFKKARNKVKWGVEHLDKLSGKTAELKDAIASPMSLVVPLLLLQTIDDIRSKPAPNTPQPSSNYGSSPIIHAFHQSDVAHRLQSVIAELQILTKKHEQSLKSLTSLGRRLPMAPQPGNQSLLWNNSQHHTRRSDEDERMVIAIDILRQELKKGTESILRILEENRVASQDNKSLKTELELYRRTFGSLHQSLDKPWSTFEDGQYPAETMRRSNDVASHTRNENHSSTQPSSGNLGSFGMAALGSFVGSIMAAVTSMLFSSAQANSDGTHCARPKSPRQFSSDFASLTYAYHRSTPASASSTSKKSTSENPVQKYEEPMRQPGTPHNSPSSTSQAQEIFSGSRTQNTANFLTKEIEKSTPQPARIPSSALSSSFNAAVSEASQSSVPDMSSSENLTSALSRNDTSESFTKWPKSKGEPRTSKAPANSTTSPPQEIIPTPAWGISYDRREPDPSPIFYCCCQCGHISLIAVMPDERCYMCQHKIDDTCVRMDAPSSMR